MGVRCLNIYYTIQTARGKISWSLLPLDFILKLSFQCKNELRNREKITTLSDHKLCQLAEQLNIIIFFLYKSAFRILWEGVDMKTFFMVEFFFLFRTAQWIDKMVFEEQYVKESNVQEWFVAGALNRFRINYMTAMLRKNKVFSFNIWFIGCGVPRISLG